MDKSIFSNKYNYRIVTIKHGLALKCISWIACAFLLAPCKSHAFQSVTIPTKKISLNEYLELVRLHNHSYAAEKFNVSIAEAQIESAKIFPNPTLSFDWTENRESGERSGYGYNVELSTTVEIGGKRSARVDYANANLNLAKAKLDDYFRCLRADATIAYFEALKQDNIFKVKQNSYSVMEDLAIADSIRFALGSITEVDYAQSKLESGLLQNEAFQSEIELYRSFRALSLMVGSSPQLDTILAPGAEFEDFKKNFILDSMIRIAKEKRSDAKAAALAIVSAKYHRANAEAERVTDVDVKLGFANNYTAGGFPSAGITAGVSIPLKFSNIYSGEVQSAEYETNIADLQYKQTMLQIENDVVNAFENYKSFERQVQNFRDNLLNGAEHVFKGKIYSYKRGETSLLEALNARRTYNETQIAYYEALFNYAVSIIEMEKAVGIWDL